MPIRSPEKREEVRSLSHAALGYTDTVEQSVAIAARDTPTHLH